MSTSSILDVEGNVYQTKALMPETGPKDPWLKIIVQGSDQKLSNDSSNQLKGIITTFKNKHTTRTEWAYTLATDVYGYTYGEALGDITIGGFCYIECDSKANGYDQLVAFYKKNRVSTEGKYCTITLGNATYKGYLISAEFNNNEDTALQLYPFSLTFKVAENA